LLHGLFFKLKFHVVYYLFVSLFLYALFSYGTTQSVLAAAGRGGGGGGATGNSSSLAAAQQAAAQGASINVGGGDNSEFSMHLSAVGRTAAALAAHAGVAESDGRGGGGWRGGKGKGGKGGLLEEDAGPRTLKGVPMKLQRIDAETKGVTMLANNDKWQVIRVLTSGGVGEGWE
jgi:hypothetical protein